MTVVVDIGNTRIKWARARGGGLEALGQAVHAGEGGTAAKALDEFAATLRDQAQSVTLSNVAGAEIEAQLRERVHARGASLTVVRPSAQAFGVQCAYSDPARLGADRWVAVIAAHLLLTGNACVIDAGTTVTLDVVVDDGRHLGGLIMAGAAMVADVLGRGTRGIGSTTAADAAVTGLALLGSSTNTAVAHGTMLGIAAGIDRAVAEVATALGGTLTVVLTGGAASALKPWLKTEVSYRPHFLLEGLARIAADRDA